MQKPLIFAGWKWVVSCLLRLPPQALANMKCSGTQPSGLRLRGQRSLIIWGNHKSVAITWHVTYVNRISNFAIDISFHMCYNCDNRTNFLESNIALCFVHSSTAGHAAWWQYSKPDKSLHPPFIGENEDPRVRTWQTTASAVAVMSFFVFRGAIELLLPGKVPKTRVCPR